MKKIICSLFLMIVISSFVFAREDTYVNEYYGINITGVEGWQTFVPNRPEEKHGIKVNFSKYGFGAIPLKSGYSLPDVNVEVGPNFFNTTDALDYAKSDIDRSFSSRFIKDFELIEGPKKIILNGREGARYVYTFGESSSRQKRIKYIFITDKAVVYLTATAGIDDFENNLPIFTQIIDSFYPKIISLAPK